MKVQEKKNTKLCSFYVSNWHMVTMLLPYVSKKVNKKEKIATILEKDIKENILTLLEKLNLKNEQKILEIDWNKTQIERINKLEKIFEGNEENINIIINGSRKFIESINSKLDNFIFINKINKKVKIINFYEVIEINENITSILDMHDKVLNTSGEKEINEIFEVYNKDKQNYNKNIQEAI